LTDSKTRPRGNSHFFNEDIETGITFIKADGTRIRIEDSEYEPLDKKEDSEIKTKKVPLKMRGKPNPINLKQTVDEAGVISIENLPFSIVHYPAAYGAGVFIGFQKEKNQPINFCSCAKYSIENFFKIYEKDFNELRSITTATRVQQAFPIAFITKLRRLKTKTIKELLNNVPYSKTICHECNRKLPAFRYSSYYLSTFEQNYGWYIYKQAYEYGINNHGDIVLADRCPQEIQDLITVTDEELALIESQYQEIRKVNERKANDFLYYQHLPLRWQQKRIMDFIENIVREKFGHKRIGEAWINETMLFYICSTLFPGKRILRHHHPTFLNGLELDIYFPDEKIGIEYQGIQHFKPIKNWGGEEALIKLQKRDKLKQELCKANQINLIYFLYDEILSDSLVEHKIKAVM
jgi:hypothetical protein